MTKKTNESQKESEITSKYHAITQVHLLSKFDISFT